MESNNKRLFFGIEILAPWPETFPEGHILDEKDRHLTLAFLGDVDYEELKSKLDAFPEPEHQIGLVGTLDKILFLPPKHPRVVAWHVNFHEFNKTLTQYQKKVDDWLKDQSYQIREHKQGFTPHTTICRSPFKENEWKKAFHPLPVVATNIHLYESLGFSKYKSCWQMSVLAPFEEMDHTADVAYLIRGETLNQIYHNAACALAFDFPKFSSYRGETIEFESLDDIIAALNQVVTQVDKEIGCPFKAVSYHGDLKNDGDILTWEMIVDV